ncbi:hypothetical protein EHV10_12065 [Lachnoanaerobaculum gingivalis]|uniref:Uncharacterized protein n=1 Tax=Lachnoanaerobaculum gingivalis TaxID=2490855 RepID=A0A3P3QTD5_9FIRM|nr:transposase [Lachnoanaerobaculum gingivalis]RRJ24516.1 hypothetical protein EHV10_12065 [Lachnoanaerobaculum gingivalis]
MLKKVCKEVLGMWVVGNESEKYWFGILIGTKNRGVGEIMIVFVDIMTRFSDTVSEGFLRE